jgi:hypothetical protein
VTLKLNDWRNINIQQNNMTFKTNSAGKSNSAAKSGVGLDDSREESSSSSSSEESCPSCEEYV